jgi:hypothetical protein
MYEFMLTLVHTDPEGDFVEVIGRNVNAAEGSRVIIKHIKDWDGFLDAGPRRKNLPTATPSAPIAVAAK